MRLRKAAVSAGLTILAVSGLSAPALAATPQTGTNTQAGWILIDNYASRFDCVDAGQQYEREGWTYKCVDYPLSVILFIR
jgi:hypothetical protein